MKTSDIARMITNGTLPPLARTTRQGAEPATPREEARGARVPDISPAVIAAELRGVLGQRCAEIFDAMENGDIESSRKWLRISPGARDVNSPEAVVLELLRLYCIMFLKEHGEATRKNREQVREFATGAVRRLEPILGKERADNLKGLALEVFKLRGWI